MAQYDAQEASIRRQQAIAKALRDSGNQGFDPAASAGRLVYARSPWEDVNKVFQQGAAAYLDNRAEKQSKELEATKTKDANTRLGGMLDTLTGKSQNVLPQPNDPALSPLSGDVNVSNPITGQSATVGIGVEGNQKRAALASMLKGQDPQAAVAALEGPALERALAQPEKLDVGGQLVWRDPITGKITSRLDKSATPDAALGAETSRYGTDKRFETDVMQDKTQRYGIGVNSADSRYATNASIQNNQLDNKTARDNALRDSMVRMRGQDFDLQGIVAKLEAEAKKEGRTLQEGERKTAVLATRINQTVDLLAEIAKTDPSSLVPGATATALGGIPGVGPTLKNGLNSMIDPARQRVEAAQEDAADAALTLATGAAYTKQQFDAIRRSLFPQLFDDDQTILDKQARLRALGEAAKIAAGRAAGDAETVRKLFSDALGLKDGLALKNAQGWELRVDANNNKAYVGPNGEVEEVETAK